MTCDIENRKHDWTEWVPVSTGPFAVVEVRTCKRCGKKQKRGLEIV